MRNLRKKRNYLYRISSSCSNMYVCDLVFSGTWSSGYNCKRPLGIYFMPWWCICFYILFLLGKNTFFEKARVLLKSGK